jgi:glycosyltransferase involved in cell wall biosynthesis
MYSRIHNRIQRKVKMPIISDIIAGTIYAMFSCFIILKYYTSRKGRIIKENKTLEMLYDLRKLPQSDKTIFPSTKQVEGKLDLSIVVPAYNVDKYLDESIVSVLSQKTQYKYELIIINDGSVDNTQDVISKYANNEGIKLINQGNKGLSNARNVGIDASRGKFIMFLDADDILLPDAIEKMVSAAIIGDYDIVEGGHVRFTDSAEIKRSDAIGTQIVSESYRTNPNYIFECAGYAWAKLYKRELWTNLGFPDGYLYEDTVIHYVLLRLCNKYSKISDTVYGYRYNPQSIMSTFEGSTRPATLDTVIIVPLIISMCEQIGLPHDSTVYNLTLKQFGKMSKDRIRGFDNRIQEAAVLLGREVLTSLAKYRPTKMTLLMRLLEKSIIDLNYNRWKLICKYI